jgi:23S rRNA (adenine2503-C2)-methyltransferase
MTAAEIKQALVAHGEPAYRSQQICEWLYRKRAKSFDEMTNRPAALRAELPKAFRIIRLEKAGELVSTEDRTTKFVLSLPDGNQIESVFLPHPRGATLCVSTQVGCAFGCRFCATGKMGFKRDLSAGEIVDQVLFVNEYIPVDAARGHSEGPGARASAGEADKPVAHADLDDDDISDDDAADGTSAAGTPNGGRAHDASAHPHTASAHPHTEGERPFANVVFMGMGEPLANYDNLVRAIDLLVKEVGIGARRLTVSTAGVPDKIMRLALLPYEVGLAISLNSPFDDIRREIMPAAGKTTLAKLLAAARYYNLKQGRIVTFEYVLIPDLNDSTRDAHALADLTRDIPAKINLLALNPYPGCPYMRPDDARVKRFQSILRQRGRKVMLRRSLGSDILAGCGQLGGNLKPRRDREVTV